MPVDSATLESRMFQKLFHQHALAQNQPNSQDHSDANPGELCIARGYDREQRNKTKYCGAFDGFDLDLYPAIG